MKKITIIIFVLSIFCWITSCNIDFKEAMQVSLNIQEAKDKKVFVSEYKIIQIQSFIKGNNFPIKSVWEEKTWCIALDKNGNQTFRINDSVSNNLVFQLNEKESFITNDNFIKGKWIMWMNENAVGSTRGMINISLQNQTLKDTISFTIYSQKEPNDHKNNLTPLFKFKIIRQ